MSWGVSPQLLGRREIGRRPCGPPLAGRGSCTQARDAGSADLWAPHLELGDAALCGAHKAPRRRLAGQVAAAAGFTSSTRVRAEPLSLKYTLLISTKATCGWGTSSSAKIASTGHGSTHAPQS